MGRACNTLIIFSWERKNESNLKEDLDVGGRIILKWILET
jgi:hypothetical protein